MDFSKAAMLLHVVEKANPTTWPKLSALHNAAMAELEELNEQAKEVMEERSVAAKAKAEKDQAKAAAAAKAGEAPAPAPRPPIFPSAEPVVRRDS